MRKNKKQAPIIDNPEDEESKVVIDQKSFMMAFVLLFATTYSSNANASLGSVINQLVSSFKSMFQPLLDTVMEGFATLLNENQNENTSKMVEVTAKGSDNIVGALQEIDNAALKRATAPSPDACNSDAIGQATLDANTASQATVDTISAQSIKTYSATQKGYHATKISNIAETFATNNEHVALGTKLLSPKITSSTSRKNAISSVELLTGPAVNSIELKESDATSTNRLKKINYLNNSSKAIRLELARNTFYTAIADRSADSGQESKMSLIEKEVSRTYESQDWRDELSNLADPTPLLIEVNKQQSFSNYLNVEILKKLEQQNLLLASSIIGSMNSSKRS